MLFDLLAAAKCQRLLQEEALEVVLTNINVFYAQWAGAFATTVDYGAAAHGGSVGGSGAGEHFGAAYIRQLLNGGHFMAHDGQLTFTEGSQLCRLTNRLLPVSELSLVYYEPSLPKLVAWEQSASDLARDERPYLDPNMIRNCLEPELTASKMSLLESAASGRGGGFAKRKRLGLVDPRDERLALLHQRMRSEAGSMYVSKEYASELVMYCVTSMAVLEFLGYPEKPCQPPTTPMMEEHY